VVDTEEIIPLFSLSFFLWREQTLFNRVDTNQLAKFLEVSVG
jgi:hypothetical protein